MTYHLRRLRGHGIIEKKPGTHRYEVTEEGLHMALFISRLERRLYREATAEIYDPWDEVPEPKEAKRKLPSAPPPGARERARLRQALNRFDKDIGRILEDFHLAEAS